MLPPKRKPRPNPPIAKAEARKAWATAASTFQSIVVSLGLIVGGFWTWYTFSALKSAERAKLELEIAALRRPVVELEMTMRQLPRVRSGKFEDMVLDDIRLLAVSVVVMNRGNVPADIDNTENTLFVKRIDDIYENEPDFDRTAKGFRPAMARTSVARMIILPGNKLQLEYLVPAKRTGLHAIEFIAPAPQDGASQKTRPYLDTDRLNPELTVWSISKVFLIQ